MSIVAIVYVVCLFVLFLSDLFVCCLFKWQGRKSRPSEGFARLRTNGVNNNGAAAKEMNFDRLGKKVRPGTFGKIKVV